MMDDTLQTSVIHDLKNQLAVLLGDLEAAEAASPDNVDIAKARQRTTAITSRLVGFLTLRRTDQTALEPVTEVNDPALLLEEAGEGAWRHIGRRLDVRIVDSDKSPEYWLYDDYLVRLVLDAALGNAGRYAKSSIELSTFVRNDRLVFRVKDDGPGLGASQGKSTGLGIQLCRAVAAGHINHGSAGCVSLLDSAEGGAVFELELP
jgi:signal transduction histidine kinase